MDVIKRYRSFRLLPRPGFAAVFGVQNGAAGADNPAALLVNKIDVNQFLIRRRMQHLPRRAAIAGDRENAVDDLVVAAGRANHPPTFLSVEAQAVKLRRRAVKFWRSKLVRLAPRMTAVRTFKDAATGQDETVVLVREIDVVDRVVHAQAALDPTCAAVVAVSQKAIVAADPSMLGIHKVNRIQILVAGTDATARPSALGMSDYRRDDHRSADESQNGFLSHCE